MEGEGTSQSNPGPATQQPVTNDEEREAYIFTHIPSDLENRFQTSFKDENEPVNFTESMNSQLKEIVLSRINKLNEFQTSMDNDYYLLLESLQDTSPQVRNQIISKLLGDKKRIDFFKEALNFLIKMAETNYFQELMQVYNRTERMYAIVFRLKAELAKHEANLHIAENRETVRNWNQDHPQQPLPKPKMLDFEPNLQGVAIALDRLIIEVFQMRGGLLRRMNNAFRKIMPFKTHSNGQGAIEALNTLREKLQEAYTNLVKVIDKLNALRNKSLCLIESLTTVSNIKDEIFIIYLEIANIGNEVELWTKKAEKDPNRLQIAWQRIQDEKKREAEESWSTSQSHKQRKQ